MGVKKYYATKDSTITNAFKPDLNLRGTGSNMGQADILEAFSIYGQSYFSSSADAQTFTSELSRVLIEFPVSGSEIGQIRGDRTAGTIPASGSVYFYLRMFNAKHAQTLPNSVTFNIQAVSASWDEGRGLDMEEYKDKDTVNWMKRNGSNNWSLPGGDYRTGSYTPGSTLPMYTTTLTDGLNDLEVDVTSMVEEWIDGHAAGHRQNYGFGVYLTSSQEALYKSLNTKAQQTDAPFADANGVLHNPSGSQESFFTKKFFGKGSEFFFKRPVLEARWDSSKKDDRGNFYFSSSLAPASDNLNTIYLYNYVRGQLKNIPDVGVGNIYVNIHTGSTSPTGDPIVLIKDGVYVTAPAKLVVSGGYAGSPGIYSASFAITGNHTTLFDVWYKGGVQYHTGTINPKTLNSSAHNPYTKCVSKITNLKSEYSTQETARFRLFVRNKDWSPTIYTKAYSTIENKIIENAYYKVFRIYDGLDIINYGTASTTQHTRLSHDVSGNYFDLDMSMLEEDYMYGIKFAYRVNDVYQEQPETFKFRVTEEV
jgi:hypothetical protein